MRPGALLLPLALAGAPALAQPRVEPTAVVRGEVEFFARGSFGPFGGRASDLSGTLSGGPALAEMRGWVAIPIAAFATGNGTRDRDLRRALDADRFPEVRFDLDSVRPSPMQGDLMVATLVGRLTLHGIERPVHLPAELRFAEPGARLDAVFAVDLRDHGVTRLTRFLGVLRADPEITLRVRLEFGDRR